MSGLSGEAVQYVDTNSKTLFIPAGLLASGSSHDVSVEVLSKGSMIAKVRYERVSFFLSKIFNNTRFNLFPGPRNLECYPQRLLHSTGAQQPIDWNQQRNRLHSVFGQL